MTNNHIRLILLDFDGTLADTRRANTLAYVSALAEAGYELPEEEYAANYFGMRCNEFLTRIGITDPAEREHIRLRKIALYPTFFDTLRLNRPLWDFCQSFRAQGGRVWIVSTGSRANIENAMQHLGIGGPGMAEQSEMNRGTFAELMDWMASHPSTERRYSGKEVAERLKTLDGISPDDAELLFSDSAPAGGAVDGILTGRDVTHSKPAPDCFLEAMCREGCSPQETLIFEDSEIGLEAARRSGAAYIKVTL